MESRGAGGGNLRWAMGGGRRCGSGLFWCCWAARTRGLGRVTVVTRMEFAAAIPRLTPCGSGFSLWRQAGELMARCVILKAGGEGRTVNCCYSLRWCERVRHLRAVRRLVKGSLTPPGRNPAAASRHHRPRPQTSTRSAPRKHEPQPAPMSRHPRVFPT